MTREQMIAGMTVCLLLIGSATFAADGAQKADSFDADPNWEKFGKTAMGGYQKQITQDFGWQATNKAGGSAPGEIGGTFARSLTRAVYWTKIPTKTLDDKLEISGKFAVPRTENDSGVHFGFFNESSTGWRTPHSLVFRLSGEDKKMAAWAGKWTGKFSWAFADLANRNWKASGIGAFDGGIYQTTLTPPILSDGKPHDFVVTYDPDGDAGEISVTIDGKTWKQPLAPGVKAEGAEFNRFGLMNLNTSGNEMEFYLDDIRMNGGELMDFNKDPGWEGFGNKTTFVDRDARPHHDLCWEQTSHAGGKPGEIAVTMWRDENPAYYAVSVGSLTMDQELKASGRLAFTAAGSDSGVYMGWFNAQAKQNKTTPDHLQKPKSLLGVAIEGPSRIGHYFRPVYATSGETRDEPLTGPIIRPDARPHRWTLHYDPKAANGNGRMTVTLDDERVELDLKPGARKTGAIFDRFGFFDIQNGGHHVKVFIDDVMYTVEK